MADLQQGIMATSGNSRAEDNIRYDNIIFLINNLERSKPRKMIQHKEKRLNNILVQTNRFWDDHPNWTINTKETKTMRNLIYQLEKKGG